MGSPSGLCALLISALKLTKSIAIIYCFFRTLGTSTNIIETNDYLSLQVLGLAHIRVFEKTARFHDGIIFLRKEKGRNEVPHADFVSSTTTTSIFHPSSYHECGRTTHAIAEFPNASFCHAAFAKFKFFSLRQCCSCIKFCRCKFGNWNWQPSP